MSNLTLVETVPRESLHFVISPYDNQRLQFTLQVSGRTSRRRPCYEISREAKCIMAMAIWLSVCLSLVAFPHYCTDLDVTWVNEGVPLVVHYWVDLQLVYRFGCYDNIAPNAKCQRVLVLALPLFQFTRSTPPSRPNNVRGGMAILP